MALVTGTFAGPGASAAFSGAGDITFSLAFVQTGGVGTVVAVQRSFDAGASWVTVNDEEGKPMIFDDNIDFNAASPNATIQWRLLCPQHNRNCAYAFGA